MISLGSAKRVYNPYTPNVSGEDPTMNDMNVKNRKLPIWIVLIIFLVIAFFAIYGFFIEPNQIQIHHVWIRDQFLGKNLRDKTVIQLSDLHIDKIGSRERNILKILDELKPDIIFLTGDYVKWKGDYGDALTFLSQLKAKTGVWGVLGDYDYSDSRKSCLFCHEAGSGKFVNNHKVLFLRASNPVRLPGESIWVGGIDMEETESLPPEKRLQFFKNKEPAIVLSHSPLVFDLLDRDQNIFMLAGDTHGGQVPLPSWLWRVLGYKKDALYSQGLFEKGHKKMFVSRGIGTSHIPFRLFRKPEIVVFHFVS